MPRGVNKTGRLLQQFKGAFAAHDPVMRITVSVYGNDDLVDFHLEQRQAGLLV